MDKVRRFLFLVLIVPAIMADGARWVWRGAVNRDRLLMDRLADWANQ